MTDLGKVIKGLECCDGYCDDETGCPYAELEPFDCQEQLRADAIALLKAQEAVKPIECNGFYYCGTCRHAFIVNRQKYCTDCGKAVKWE
jgi:hypothetical protein